MTGFPEYRGRNRFPKKQPKGICRGCRGTITEKHRKTWCSQACKEKFDPWHVKHAVEKRDGNRCVFCGKDCSRKSQWIYRNTAPKSPQYARDCKLPFPLDSLAYYAHPLYKQFEQERKEWKRNQPKSEFDHIVPHCEGGHFTVENIRLLCKKCHQERTTSWKKSRAFTNNSRAVLVQRR